MINYFLPLHALKVKSFVYRYTKNVTKVAMHLKFRLECACEDDSQFLMCSLVSPEYLERSKSVLVLLEIPG